MLFSYPFYEADFRKQMLSTVKDFSMTSENGLFINSCFARCQSERQSTWFADDDYPLLENQAIALFCWRLVL
ncbi:putative pectinacetylesterase/NOTUM [Rosa chinensis]|uniref:Pectin acetylesterase n=1 Tax=Rosa chinensis TaxID=74649 RepID=A0A2P6PJW4_ROSCH|nr:putative pectinacetylesterase/NOTUM [Rosa chinensis]